jgi:hypothetical protein
MQRYRQSEQQLGTNRHNVRMVAEADGGADLRGSEDGIIRRPPPSGEADRRAEAIFVQYTMVLS